MADPEQAAVAFARVLRGAGLDVPLGSVATFVDALAAVGAGRRSSVYWAGRATLVRRPEDVPTYDRVFAAFWLGGRPAGRRTDEPAPPKLLVMGDDAEAVPAARAEEERPERATTMAVRYSPHELLRHKDFALYSDDEFEEARRLLADLRVFGAFRRSRRLRPSDRRRGRPDLRRTARLAIRAGGEPVERAFREQRERPRRVVLLCDVSGSMEPYARALARFLHTAVIGRSGRVEAFALGTRLTRITRQLSSRDPDAALAAAAAAVVDWGGGTRLGEGLRAFNDTWGLRGMARGAVVVILSDGWDRGDPAVLAEQMARLRRVAYRLVWVNPLKSSPGYAPLTRGMAAALPYVDEFVEGHSLASLEALAAVVSRAAGPASPSRRRTSS
jgi:uncharacterized protein with von Willebrand factor type A (vWA) domain